MDGNYFSLMRRGFHNTTPFTTIARHQPSLLAIEAFIFSNNPLVKAPFTQGLALRLFCSLWLPEPDDVSHGNTGGQCTLSVTLH
jgi:hypothetical protein